MDRLFIFLRYLIDRWFIGWDDDQYVPAEVLMQFREENPSIVRKRQESIAYLRSFNPSKYVLDGAKVSWVAGLRNATTET